MDKNYYGLGLANLDIKLNSNWMLVPHVRALFESLPGSADSHLICIQCIKIAKLAKKKFL